ncbi:MAG: rRNA pseudouridine synthase [Oscillospiraceae bacterium]|nr:rRNA pseudouridine synthase [Oscillospiraceae bacterium]
MTERLQKIIARAGLCSRRAAEELLRDGRVSVNGQTAQLGDSADLEYDTIEVDGKALSAAPPKEVYVMLNKPRGYVTTMSDELGRKTAAELVSGCGARVLPVGRLDKESEGLLLFTNDGALIQQLIHPKGEVDKVYRVTVQGALDGAAQRLAALRDVEGEPIRPAQVTELRRGEKNALLQVVIHEGKNRQIRRMCRQCGLEVLRLQRIAEHTLMLGDLKAGQWRYLTAQEVRSLKEGEGK